MEIQILTTGGTIEGLEYDNLNQIPIAPPMPLSKLLSQIDHIPKFHIKTILLKDSRFINDDDRNLIASEVRKSNISKILITHGTLTMVETAKFLGKLNSKKTIVLTGAFILGTHPKSDAFENLSFALTEISSLKTGVYIAMHETIFYWNNVKKNICENRFEYIEK